LDRQRLIDLSQFKQVRREAGMAKPLFVAIGVHKAATMPELDGVLSSVRNLSNWAAGEGYEVVRIDDGSGRVTVDRIKEELTPLDAATGDWDPKRLLDRPRIVVYFCGHGLHAPQDQYWILSAGPNQDDERISAVGFRDILTTYGPKQIAFISDACRVAQTVRGLARSVVGAYEALGGVVQKDTFFSSLDGEASFTFPSKDGKPAYCVFSSVLVRALSRPTDPEALSGLYLKLGRMIVSSRSLANYLEQKVPEAALDVGKLQMPQCDPGFREEEDYYVDFGSLPVPSPAAVEARQAKIATERAEAQDGRIVRSRSEWRKPYAEGLQPLIGPVLTAFIEHYGRGPLLLSSDSDAPNVEAPGLLPSVSIPETENLLQHVRVRQRWNFTAFQRWNFIALVDKPFADSGRSGVAVVRVADLFAALPLHHQLWCTAIIDKGRGSAGMAGGVELLAWGGQYPPLPPRLSAAEALKGLSAGTLNAEDTAILAEDMRYMKHADPMYGIVAAYLYNAIGDVSNIRRMCYYYKYYAQDIPFDIAMLGQLELKGRPNGGFYIEVPEIAELTAAERRPDAPSFVWEKTPAVTADVAGVTPLLRTGWQHIQASRHAVHRRCWELTPYLTESPISTFQGHEVGARLIEILREL
jgi:hypothetical protein